MPGGGFTLQGDLCILPAQDFVPRSLQGELHWRRGVWRPRSMKLQCWSQVSYLALEINHRRSLNPSRSLHPLCNFTELFLQEQHVLQGNHSRSHATKLQTLIQVPRLHQRLHFSAHAVLGVHERSISKHCALDSSAVGDEPLQTISLEDFWNKVKQPLLQGQEFPHVGLELRSIRSDESIVLLHPGRLYVAICSSAKLHRDCSLCHR
mmetsp:Transcript_45798/g.106391  ORF Transcript_45798/g.106391 Transcript_45798/m.106391 type:complete len:207 (-) Transcript_45798:825-1445(-)